ncbi:MAG: hypothetical protein Q4E10_03440 [Porphyromonas sp.]|nr:hypothetical protein [Porphyromonas sp.]
MSVSFILLILLLSIITAALILAEIFFVPGIGLLGILGSVGFIGIEYYLITQGLGTGAVLFAAIAIIAFVIGFYLLSRNKFIKKVELTDTVDEVAVKLPDGIVKGSAAIAESRLVLGGTIRLADGTLVEAESEDGFIDDGEAVYISDVRNQKVYVKRQPK